MYSYQFIFYVYKGKCKIQSENIFFLAADELREIQIHTNTEQDNENEEFVPIQLEKNQAVFEKGLLELTSKFFGKMNGSVEAANSLMRDVEEILDLTITFFYKGE